MNNKFISRIGWKSLIGGCLLLLGLLSLQQWSGLAATADSPAARVERAWDNVRLSSNYAFAADIAIKTIPLPTPGNIGRFSKTENLYVEGQNDLASKSMEMALWGGGVSVANRDAAYQMRVRDGRVQTRAGDGEWQSSDENAVALAPEGDFLAFLDMADNVVLAPERVPGSGDPACIALDCSQLAVYTFDLNGRAYATKLTELAQEQMTRSGQLPEGASVKMPEHLAGVTGSGELWVDSRGLPVRQKVSLAIPAAAGADYRSEAEMDIRFSNYEGAPANANGWQRLAAHLSRVDLPSASEVAVNFGLVAMVLLGAVVLVRPSRRTKFVTTVAALVAIICTPTLQAQAASVAAMSLTARQTAQAAEEQKLALEQAALDLRNAPAATGPYIPPALPDLSAATSNVQSSTLDSDADGLTDEVERMLGTSALASDSDQDTIADNVEVAGFAYAGKQWYGNPLLGDSNGDGAVDGQEWDLAALDHDSDNTPDLYDLDDDGDGVPDKLDISRLVASKSDSGAPITFTRADPLQLSIDGLNPGSYSFVELQLRPTNPDRLWYAFNVLNWPKDEKGNAQDWDQATYFDFCQSTGGSNCAMSPDDNGDIKLVPMLEIAVPDLSNLPRRGDGSLDQGMLDNYGIDVRPAGDGTYFIYAPLNLVQDPMTGAKVAFQGQLVYQAGAKWAAQPVRLIWAVNLLNEQYTDPEAAKTKLQQGGGVGDNRTIILHVFYDDFLLTGLNVREDRGVDMAVVYEDPAVDVALNDDDALFEMTIGLSRSFLTNRDCNFVDNDGACVGDGRRDITINTIAQRWNHPTNSGITEAQRWGIGDYLRVETRSYPTQDHATMQAGQELAPQILDARFKNTAVTAPALLYVRETRLRTLNADGRGAGAPVTWTDRTVRVNFSGETVLALGSYNLAPYRYNTTQHAWESFPADEYIEEVVPRYWPEADEATATEKEVFLSQADAVYGGSLIIVNMKGNSATLSTNAEEPTSFTNTGRLLSTGLFKVPDLSDEALREAYLDALATVGVRIGQLARFSDDFPDEIVEKLFHLTRPQNASSSSTSDSQTPQKPLSYEERVREMEKNTGLDVDAMAEFQNKVKASKNLLAGGSAVFMLVSIGGLLAFNSKHGQVAGEAMIQSVGAVASTVDAVITYSEMSALVKLKYPAAKPPEVASKVLSGVFGVKSAAFKAGAAGAVIGIGITWIAFFAAWGSGIPVGSVAFNTVLAGAIASTLVIVMTFLISLTVVGAIILAVFAIFDLFAFIACKAGAKKACDIGITAAIIKVLTDWIYTGGIMIDTGGKPPISTIKSLSMRLTDPYRGLVAGNGVQFEANLDTTVRHLPPEPSVVYVYDDFFTAEDIASTSVRYKIGPQEEKIKTTLNQTDWSVVGVYSYVEAEAPSPVIGWLVPLSVRRDLWFARRDDRAVSPVYPFTKPQINQSFPLKLNIGMALPTFDCWFSVCEHKSAQVSTTQDLSDQFVLDILPTNITDFVNWGQLGPQFDRDGDGLGVTTDPDPTRWDADSDGLSDSVELRYGYNPRQADSDSDSLNDAIEYRYQTNPRRADTDGDGISDANEINGYTLSIGGHTVFATSDPTKRDTDGDGMSDSAEQRLNGIEATRYPFHPRVFNDPPVRIYNVLNDADRVLAVGASTTMTTTVYNGTTVENNLVASGRFTATLPSQLGGATQSRPFNLLPTTRASIVLNGVAAASNGAFNATSGAAADLVPVGTTATGTADDIILDSPFRVIIDSDLPHDPVLTLGAFVQPGRTAIIGGTADDPTSYISQVAVNVNGGGFNTASGTSLWAFPLDIPNISAGTVPITVRASDAVSNTKSANFNLSIDGVSPALTVGLNPGDVRRVRRNADNAWTLPLSGTVSDALAGFESLTLQIGASANVVMTSTAVAVDGVWSIDYPFDDPSFNAESRPTGPYTLTVTARDTALPDGNPVTQVIPFTIDMTPPTVTLLSHEDDRQLTDGAIITGTVSDANAAIVGVDIAFVSAQTVLATGNTLLRLPLNDLPETVLFANTATVSTRVFCLDESCPVSGESGEDGTSVRFAANDLLRTFEPLDLPESGLTTALWFNTTCADCGLFTVTQGVYPAVTQHDRDLFLQNGKICSSILVGASREVRCTVADSFADGAWHQVVHTLGADGNALYADGQLAVSSPTTASVFATQDGVLVGYSPAAATPFLTGRLDDIAIYDGALSAESAVALYRQWRPVTFGGGEWSYTVPTDLEGYYQIDMRATDAAGNTGENRSEWPQFRGPIDTKFPKFDLSVDYSGSGSAAQTTFSSVVADANLTTEDYNFVCPLAGDQLRYITDPTQLNYTGQPDGRLTAIDASCVRSGFQNSLVATRACDVFGHCGAATPPQTVAYIGARQNTLNPYGSLPNGIERTVLSDPQSRTQVVERPGQTITDIAIDETRGKLYWGEVSEGDYAQPGQVMRANLDGSGVEALVTGLLVYAPEALQIAVDPAGNKLYWTKGHELWWANLDGSLPEVVYTIDRAVVGVSQVGDVVVDSDNGRLYFAERRLHGTLAAYEWAQASHVTYIPYHGRKHTLIVTTNLNGTAPEIFAGVGPGCTYANFYDNQGTGTGLGLRPTLCLSTGTDGFDVESLTVSDGTVYWTAISADSASSAAFGKVPGGSTFTVAPLDVMDGNSEGLRFTPLPHLYVAPGSAGVFAMLKGSVVRGERDGEFTVFSRFDEPEPAVAGLFTRKNTNLTALSVVRVPQSLQTKADLFARVTSPDLVLVNGGTGHYKVRLGNNSAVPAANATLTLILPSGGSFVDANGACTASGETVTCDLGQLEPFSQQTLAINFTIATSDVRTLTTAVEIGTPLPDANPVDNTASHAGITAAPTLADLPGIPYIYSANLTEMWRVPLVGDAVNEYVGMDNGGIGGKVLATDATHGKLIINNIYGQIATVNPDGTGYTVIANANPDDQPIHDDRLAVAVDETTGRIFWTEIDSLYLSIIKSANLDGSGVQTIVPNVLNQRGLAIDMLRRKLLWVGSDSSERQDLIFRSNLDGTEVEVAYAAPAGQQIRYLAIDPYAQKLYWLDASYEGGSLFWADSDGQRVGVLHSHLGDHARGLVVRPLQNALYFSTNSALVRTELDGANWQDLVSYSSERYTGVSNLNPSVFPYTFINAPQSNLVLAFGGPFAPATCSTLDGNEPNDTPAQATTVGVGSFTAALCRSTSANTGLDHDVYKVTVPAGQQLDVTLNPPANYDIYLQRGDLTVDVSAELGTAADVVTVANYSGAAQDYTFTVHPMEVSANLTPYAINVALSDAPPQTVFTNEQCAAVDSHDAPGGAGNGSQANATPLTVGQPITGALCYQSDTDFYKFSGQAGQQFTVELPVRPADYPLYVYRPDGSLFNAYAATGTWTYGMPFTLDASGDWAVAVADVNLTETLSQYQLLVSDVSCAANDGFEPNNGVAQASDISGQSRVFATLCSDLDIDYYQFNAAAGQKLTVNYPANAAGATLVLRDSAGTELGQVEPGAQRLFSLADTGVYRLSAANRALTSGDAAYMFQWLLDAPTPPTTDTQYVYYGDYPHLVRVALSNDHTVEPILIDGGATGGALASSSVLGKLYLVEPTTFSLVSADFDGHNRTVIIPNANPDGVGTLLISVAVDDLGGRVYWIQPRGAVASTAADLMSATLSGGDVQLEVANVYQQRSLLIDPVVGRLYWVAGEEIHSARLDGSDAQLVRAAVPGEQVRDLALDPFAQKLYWLDPVRQVLVQANSDGSAVTSLISGLDASARGLAVRPLQNELYYSNGATMVRATLSGGGATNIASLSGQYQGPSNLDPNAYLLTPIDVPESNLVLGHGSPIVSPCTLADSYEPNNDQASATPLSFFPTIDIYAALCNSTIGQPNDQDRFSVSVPDRKTLSATLTQLPANYRVFIVHPDGYTAAFSDQDGLADEFVTISNTSGADAMYTVVVFTGYYNMSASQYKLSLAIGDVPPPPNPDDAQCGAVDIYDAPAPGGNGTLASATPIGFGAPVAAALCYADDVDMYTFQGVAGQTVTLDLPTRPQDYTLTLYDPAGAVSTVISATTALAYGAPIALSASGPYTVSVSQPGLTPTTDQYQLLVGDGNCVASDANEPNNGPASATTLVDGSRVQASLCSSGDVDLYHFLGAAGQQLTLNYPANATGAALVLTDADGQIGAVNAGGQEQFSITSAGWYTLTVSNNAVPAPNIPYRFQVLLRDPVGPPAGAPYIYYSRVVDLIRAEIATGGVEPLLIETDTTGGPTIAADNVRGKLYILTNLRNIARVDFDGRNRVTVVPTVSPNGVLRPTESLAVDEISGRIYWTEALFGVVTRILSANGDGSDVQEVIPTVVYDHGIAVDSVAGHLYWAGTDTYLQMEFIRRSNLDGSGEQTVYMAPTGSEIRDLAVDPYARKLYWRDPTQNRLFWLDADGGVEPLALASLANGGRGMVVRPLQGELYYTDGADLFRAGLDGSAATLIARFEGAYNGVSNLSPDVFYPTTITPPESNLALGFSQPFAQPCGTLDVYEPNDSEGTAAAIGVGTISAVLCSSSLTNLDNQDYYSTTVDAGKQISVTLHNLPQNYGLGLLVDGQWVGSSYQPGLVDEFVTHVNNSASARVYTILVERFADTTSSSLPFDLTVAVGDPAPPPPPPPPPPDACAPFDAYDLPGADGNGSRSQATPIGFNTPITAALCYTADKDYYAFDGVVGQNVTINLNPRPADYYIYFYNPDGEYVTGIFPDSWLHYGDSFTLNVSGRWTVLVWYPYLAPTTDQYHLQLSVNTACSALDPYEPNDNQFAGYTVLTPTVTLRTMLCETGDQDWYSFPMTVGSRIRITPRILSDGVNGNGDTVNMNIGIQPPGFGFGEIREPYEYIASSNGDFVLGVYTQPRVTENLPYEIDVEIIPPPTPTPLPNNWTCTTYPSTDIPHRIEDLTTLGSTVNVPANGTVTHVGIKDITFNHKGLFELGFGLGAPDGTLVDLFHFDDHDFYVWCGEDGSGNATDCRLSLDDAAIEGLTPPQPPNDGGTFRPSRNSFAPFNGKASSGVWTLLVSDNGLSEGPGPGNDFPDTTGDLFGWSLEVCVDNGQPPAATPTPTATPTPAPQPVNGTPIATLPPATPTPTPTPAPDVCTLTADAYEDDDTPATASAFDQPNLTSRSRTFDTAVDEDWMTFSTIAGREYIFSAIAVGGDAPVTLAIYESNGTTLIATAQNQVSFTAATAGDYLLRAKSGVGIANPCSAAYTVGLEVLNPNATPVPTPIGPPLPAGHDAPPLSAAVLTPAGGAVMTQTQTINLQIGLNAANTVQSAELFANGASIGAYPTLLRAMAADNDLIWQTDWTPPHAGAYAITAVITDSANMTGTSPINMIFVDLADPAVTITAEDITLANTGSDGVYLLNGTATDDSRVDKVEVRLDGGPWQEAVLDGSDWSFSLAPLAQANPNGGSLAIEARATDKADRTATALASVIVDVTPPATFASTASLISSGAPISPTLVTNELGVRLSWPADIDGVASIYAGWTSEITPTLGALTAYGPTPPYFHDQVMPEASAMYAHVVAIDAYGNRTANSGGPYYFDTAQTPDLIADLAQENWVQSGGKQVGQMPTADHGVQKMFAGWNADRLRLRWQGFDISSEGDLYFYLGTGGSGVTDLYNPFGPAQTGVLPFAADYVVFLRSTPTGIVATLLGSGGGSWTEQSEVSALSSGELTDVLLPFADLGIADPTAARLKLLGVASVAGDLGVWATAPDQNLGRIWTQYVEFASLGSGIVPTAGVWDDTLLEVVVSPDPLPATLLGVGDPVSVTLDIKNVGAAMLPLLTVDGATAGGLSLTNSPQIAANIPTSGTVALTLNGTVTADGEVALKLADSYHRTYTLETLAYKVDAAPPISVTVAVSYVVPYSNTLLGSAQDDSPLSLFELQIDDGAGTEIVQCAVNGTVSGGYACEWNAGNRSDGAALTMRARATDVHGNASDWSDPVAVVVDATPPELTLSSTTEAALSDGWLSAAELALSGVLTDDRAPDRTQLCTDDPNIACSTDALLPDGSWTLFAPALGDAVPTTLALTGYDLAGNASQAMTRAVIVDSVRPVLGSATVTTEVFTSSTATLLGNGVVTDGGGVAKVEVYVVKPDGSSAIVQATLSGSDWASQFIFDQVGEYQALAAATDTAGNRATQFLGIITAYSAMGTPQAPVVTVSVVDATTLALTWDHVTQDLAGNPINVTAYQIYRSDDPFAMPATPWRTVSGPFGATVTEQISDLGASGLIVYQVVAVADVGTISAPSLASTTVGKFEFEIVSPAILQKPGR